MMHLSHKRSNRYGFTLIELLVVVTIIGLLIGLAFPTLSVVMKKARQTECQSNLRQIGIALNGYIGDNDGELPGPMWSSGAPQPYVYDDRNWSSIGRSLARWLQPYLDTPESKNGSWEESPPFKSPSYIAAVPKNISRGNRRPYIINHGDDNSLLNPAGNPIAPFGKGTSDSPKRIHAIDSESPLSQVWLMRELDAGNVGRYNVSWVPAKPLHGKFRNTLFFDMHVEAVRLEDSGGLAP